jgi:dynein heavy chain
VDAVLDPLLGRNLIKRGRAIKIGDKEMEYNPKFRLILQTKLANPHYKPEMQAQTTLINFTVTRDGLEEQLLAEVVKAERPDLEKLRSELTKQQNDFKITLKVSCCQFFARSSSVLLMNVLLKWLNQVK